MKIYLFQDIVCLFFHCKCVYFSEGLFHFPQTNIDNIIFLYFFLFTTITLALISSGSYLVLLLKCPIATLSSTLGDFVDEEENYFIRWHNIPPMLANVDGSWSLFQKKIKVQWYFLSFLNTDSTGSQEPSPGRIKTHLPCVVYAVAVDVLVTQRARTSAVMVVTYLSRSILGFWRQKVFITIQLSFMYAHLTWTCSGVLRFKCAVSEPKSFIADCHNATRVTPLTLSQCTLAGPVYTGMPLECHWLTQCTLGYHWKNLVETAPHWNATGET